MQTRTAIQLVAAVAGLSLASLASAQFTQTDRPPSEINLEIIPGLGHTIQPDLPLAFLPTGPFEIPRKDRLIPTINTAPPIADRGIPEIREINWGDVLPGTGWGSGSISDHRVFGHSEVDRVRGIALPGPSSIGLLVIAGLSATRRRRQAVSH